MELSNSRLNLHNTLLRFCNNVYFQPPASVKLKYPCIIYELDDIEKLNASDIGYKIDHRYSITYITKDPVDNVIDELVKLQMCVFERYFVSDNLHHYNYTIYYK